MSKVSKEKMKDDIDEFGDFYFVDVDVPDMKQVFVTAHCLVQPILLPMYRKGGRQSRTKDSTE
jgi:hypothetical protein